MANPVIKRIQKELIKMEKDAPLYCSAGPIDEKDIFKWEGQIVGPSDSP